MIPLAPSFRQRGFHWRVLQREGDVALVEQNKTGWLYPAYNVVIVQKRKTHKWPDGSPAPAREGMPNWEQWGEQAWAYSDKAAAKVRFNIEVNRRQNALSKGDVLPK